LRIYEVPEASNRKDDGEEVLIAIAEELGIELDYWDIQGTSTRKKKRKIKTLIILLTLQNLDLLQLDFLATGNATNLCMPKINSKTVLATRMFT